MNESAWGLGGYLCLVKFPGRGKLIIIDAKKYLPKSEINRLERADPYFQLRQSPFVETWDEGCFAFHAHLMQNDVYLFT